MKRLMADVWNDEHGQDLVEYALIMVFIALGVAVSLLALQTSVTGVFDHTKDTFQGQAGGGQ